MGKGTSKNRGKGKGKEEGRRKERRGGEQEVFYLGKENGKISILEMDQICLEMSRNR